MKYSPEIEALRALDRAITPAAEVDARIRERIEATIDEEASLITARFETPESLPDVTILDLNASSTVTSSESDGDKRSWRPRRLLLGAAVLVLIAGLGMALGNRASTDKNVVVADNVDRSELSPVERICTGAYARLADDWRVVLESSGQGYAVSPTFQTAQTLVQSQRGFVDAILTEIEAGELPELTNPDTLATTAASIEASQAVLDLEGNNDLVNTIGNTHQQLGQLIEENRSLASSCDAALVAWPQ